MAAAWYRAAGYEILARNWRCREGEIDLVCRIGPTVVVCEVKTRRSLAFGLPSEAVTAAKRRRLRRLAVRWMREAGVVCREVRFDVVAVTPGVVEVIKDAF